jgi:uncharacterized protein YqhQ
MNIGGQAVIEGVMMRSPNAFAVAVRRPDGQIAVWKESIRFLTGKSVVKWPVIRGVPALFDALLLGIRALNFSAKEALGEDAKDKGNNGFLMGLTIFAAFGIGIFIFLILPLLITWLLQVPFPVIERSSLVFNAIDGALRVIIFLGYVTAISFLKDIERVFQYHGAEHKAVYAFEAGEEVDVANARKYSILHPRCGTSFLLMVMLISIVTFSFIPKEWELLYKILARIVLIPVIAGIAYEFIKISSKKMHHRFIRYLILPGLWLQRLTTREPTDEQIEVAIRALKEAVAIEPVIN